MGVRLIPEDTPILEAEEIRRTDDPEDFRQGMLTEAEFEGVKMEERVEIVQGFIAEKTINIINGWRGCGKSWLAMSIANGVTWGDRVGPWKVGRAVNVMLVDGEMPMSLLQERLKEMNRGRDVRRKKAEMWLYPESYAYRIGLRRASLLDPEWRRVIQEGVEERDVQLLILDNLSSLAPGIDENDKQPFDAVNRWLLEMRFRGVTIVMTHHTGKSGEQRGTSAHEDHADLCIVLKPPGREGAGQGCAFDWCPTKDRAFVTEGRSIRMRLERRKGGGLDFKEWKGEGRLRELCDALIQNPDMKWEEAEEFNLSRATFYREKARYRTKSVS